MDAFPDKSSRNGFRQGSTMFFKEENDMLGSMGCNTRTVMFTGAGGSVTTTFVTGAKKTKNAHVGRKKKTKPKKLHYNHKEVSNRILKSKTSESAGRTVVLARNKLASLRRKMGTGEYNEKELDSAIIHAMKMLRIAKKKQKHLRQEEQIEREGSAAPISPEEQESTDELTAEDVAGDPELSREEIQEMMREMERLMQEAMEDLEEAVDDSMEELSNEMFGFYEEMSPEDLELLKKKRRAEEMRQIVEADMKYLKAMFEQMEQESKNTSGSIVGVTLELRGVETPVVASEAPVAAEGANMDMTV